MYKLDAVGRASYKESVVAVEMLESLKVEEQHIMSTTTAPESLLDVSRKQQVNRSLINIDDELFHFFLNLTDMCLSLLIDDNVNKHGEQLFNHVRVEILANKDLFGQFCATIVESDFNVDNADEIKNELLNTIYQKIIKIFLTVMVNQFRKDLLETLNVQKKMAHRKQVRVSGQIYVNSQKSTEKCIQLTKTRNISRT